jgi:dihydropteroate synthase
MAILNVTPDSFSDGGVHFDPVVAIEVALRMEADGAAMIDVGGESTRPGSDAVPIDEELARVIPVIEGIRRRSAIAISIDTRKARVAEAAIEAGANIINDVSALRHDPEMRPLAARTGACRDPDAHARRAADDAGEPAVRRRRSRRHARARNVAR